MANDRKQPTGDGDTGNSDVDAGRRGFLKGAPPSSRPRPRSPPPPARLPASPAAPVGSLAPAPPLPPSPPPPSRRPRS